MAEEELSARLARIAREVEARGDLASAGEEIVRATAELFDAGAEAGISLVHDRRHVTNGGASSESARRGDDLQNELGEGPCLDAVWQHEQVYSGDLANDGRWPTWGPRMAEEFGITTMLCSQLFTDGQKHLGALNIYSTRPDAFDEADQDVARSLATHVALAVSAVEQVEGLRHAIDRRTDIGKALGIVMIKYGLSDDRAFDVLRRLSNHENRRLHEVAADVVRTRGLPPGQR